jgi:pSer/pThr/pTyr-binding forkhead associated (FHA) protein
VNPREITLPPGLSPSVPATPVPPPAASDELVEDRTVFAQRTPRTPPSAAAVAQIWVLVTPAGAREPISGVVVVGRQPAKTAFKGSDRSLKLVDPDGQMSKSHAAFEVDDAGLWVRDLGSTNGVVVITPDGREIAVDADARVAVPDGSEVELGGYVVTVEREG